MRRVALVSAHFPPSNLVGVHRARIWAQYLPEFGWVPTVVTTHWKHYQEALDWDLLNLVSDDVCVIRTEALGLRYAKIIGNMALRAMWWTRQELIRLADRDGLDFIHIIVPDHYSALLGPMLHKSRGIPYGIDYMDPWVHASASEKTFLSKAWFSCVLSEYLEPWSVKSSCLVTGVSRESFEGVLRRNAMLERRLVTAEIPMANPASDYNALADGYKPTIELFDPQDGRMHIVYAGSIPPSFFDSIEYFLSALKTYVNKNRLKKDIRVWLIGTGTKSGRADVSRVEELIDAFSLADYVTEYPSRIGYLDVLWHLKAATVVLVLGSTEKHYTPSKAYQAAQSNNPVLALVPDSGRVAQILRASGAGVVVNFPDERQAVISGIERALSAIAAGELNSATDSVAKFEDCAARLGARQLAESFNSARNW